MFLRKMIRRFRGADESSSAEQTRRRKSVEVTELPVITEAYRDMQRKLHENPKYGIASVSYAPLVAQVIEALHPAEMLDYGAGKGRLGEELGRILKKPPSIRHYDPAIPQWSELPVPCGFVTCIDVLEHIEPALLDNVLDDLKRVVEGFGVFTVHVSAAKKILPDGRNAHLIQRPAAWWLPKFLERFELMTFDRMPMGFCIVVERKKADDPRKHEIAWPD